MLQRERVPRESFQYLRFKENLATKDVNEGDHMSYEGNVVNTNKEKWLEVSTSMHSNLI